MWRWCCLIVCLFSSISWAAIDTYEFDNEVSRLRYQSFIDEIRCPKCQNQSISDSNSPIALDLRRELYTMIEDGRADKEIIDFMVARYGDYILYRPRVTPFTLLLWFGPAGLLIIGVIVLMLIVRQRRHTPVAVSAQPLSATEQQQLAELLQATHITHITSITSAAKPKLTNKDRETD